MQNLIQFQRNCHIRISMFIEFFCINLIHIMLNRLYVYVHNPREQIASVTCVVYKGGYFCTVMSLSCLSNEGREIAASSQSCRSSLSEIPLLHFNENFTGKTDETQTSQKYVFIFRRYGIGYIYIYSDACWPLFSFYFR